MIDMLATSDVPLEPGRLAMLNWILYDSSRTATDKETIIMPRVPDSEAFPRPLASAVTLSTSDQC